MGRTHAILVTHTPLRLRRTILGVAWSSVRVDTLTVSCDADDPAIEAEARGACAEGSIGLTLLMRQSTGKGRSAQARNNAVRSLVERGAGEGDALVFFDGDCVPEHRAIERHAGALSRGELALGWRFEMTEAQTAVFDEAALRAGAMPIEPSPEQRASIAARQRRLRAQIRWKRLGLGKEHKPKVLGANFSCLLGTYARVNGHDETYEGWAQEDDDFGRRVYRSGGRPVPALTEILSFHQHHPTRAPADWAASSNAWRLSLPCETVCERGLRNPLEQPELRSITIEPRR